ncbi:MAG TPA: alkaline phosphatase [Woeseiaceae bacterium]|nr:alkaline phosphatase [Woeseiaceae bacterium]
MTSLAACSAVSRPAADEAPGGIVLVVGDGMGAAHFTLARLLRGEDYRIGTMPEVGLVATHAVDTLVTDSAAAATAFATGVKTVKGAIGTDPSGAPVETVLEAAEARGLATGLVTTTVFVDATPAAFAAHAQSRAELGVIAQHMLSRGIEVIAGTGLERFGRDGWPEVDELARDNGYRPARNAAELAVAGSAEEPVLAILPSADMDAQSPEATLADLATWTLERLARNPAGFFLLVEHEGTDTASHRNRSAGFRKSVVELDEAVGAVLDFARRRGDVLVIVVGDHETGGLQVAGTPGAPELVWRDDYHSGEAVPIFAEGPGAAAFGRFIDNTDVGRTLRELVGRMGSAPSPAAP